MTGVNGVFQFSLNNNHSLRTKHVINLAKFIQHTIYMKGVVLEFLCTNEKINDVFTKTITCQKQTYFKNFVFTNPHYY